MKNILILILVASLLYIPFTNSIVSQKASSGTPYSSPILQFKSGTPAQEVVCKSNLQLVIKASNAHPACVTPQTAQQLIERGWAMKSTLANKPLENSCGQFNDAPKSQNDNTVPVLLMDSNSTACVRLTFTIVKNYSDISWPRTPSLASMVSIGNYNFHQEGQLSSVTPGKDYTNSFQITVVPQTIDLAKFSIDSNFTATYIIKPLSNATGFYDHSVPMISCEHYPLVVGYAVDKVNYSDFSYIFPLHSPCAAGPYILSAVKISGMAFKEVVLRENSLTK